MIKSYETLPEGYEKIKAIDLEKDRGLFWLLNLGAIVLYAPFFVMFFRHVSEATPFSILLVFPIFVINIIIHELIHAIFFKLSKGVKVRYKFHGFAASASCPDIYFKKWHYLAVGLAPFVILGIVYVAVIILAPAEYKAMGYLLLGNHVASCLGDYLVSYYLLKYKNPLLVNDYGVGMKFYQKA